MQIIPEISKDKSLELKGIAILFMMFGHLMTDSVSTFVSRSMGPVAFFLVLSGYGMYEVNKKQDVHRWSRIFKIFVNYWVVLAIVSAIGLWSNPDYYSFSASEVLGNVIALEPTYIPEVWFLLPYVLLTTSCRWIIPLLEKYRGRYVFILLFLLNIFTSYSISRYGSSYLYGHRIVYVLFCYFHLMFPFALGMLMAKYRGKRFVSTNASFRIGSMACLFALLILMLLRCVLNTSVIHSLYVFLFFSLYLKINVPHIMEMILRRLGKCSMNMWFIHTSAFIYLWPDRPLMDLNPIIYFIIVVAVCWIFAEIINACTQRLLVKI